MYIHAFSNNPDRKKNAYILIRVFSENVTLDVIGKRKK